MNNTTNPALQRLLYLQVQIDRMEQKLDKLVEWTKLFEVEMMTEKQIMAQLEKQINWPSGEPIKRLDTPAQS